MRVEKLTMAQLAEPKIRESACVSAERFIAEAGYPFPLNRQHFLRSWEEFTFAGLGSFYAALDDDGFVKGGFGALFFPDVFSGRMHASESFWFVAPEHRNSSVGLKLFNAFESEARERKCEGILMIHLDGLNAEVLEKLYLRKGYKPAEKIYRKLL